MKRSVLMAILACNAWIPMVRAATEAEKASAVRKGVAYLLNTQQDGGYWGAAGNEQAATGAVAFALLSQQDKWGADTALYQSAVDRAMAWLVRNASTIDVSTRSDGVNICPGGTGSCRGVYWYGNSQSAYTTGLVSRAIAVYGARAGARVAAAGSGPLAGLTWGEIAQAITNALAASQSTGGNKGGWGAFIPGTGDADSLSTHSAVLSLLYDEALDAVTPEPVRNDLKLWLAKVQSSSGAVCYQPDTQPCNHAYTGGWLLAMRFAGDGISSSQVQAALFFLNASWHAPANDTSRDNFGQPYAMWAVYQGLETTVGLNETTHIVNLLTGCGAGNGQAPGTPAGALPCTWSEDYNQWLVNNQNEDGSWSSYSDWGAPLTTAFLVNILGGVRIPLAAAGQAPVSILQSASGTPAAAPQTGSTSASAPAAQAVQPAASGPRPRPRNRKGVAAMALTDDGNTIVCAGRDNRIRIWDSTTGQQLRSVPDLVGVLTGMVVTPGGATLATVGRDSVLRVWDRANGTQLGRLAGHEHAIRAIAASPDGKFLASAGEDTRVLLWDVASRKLNRILPGSTDFVNSLSFSPDSRLLATADERARALIFDVASGKSLYVLRGHSGAIDAVSFSPDGAVLATAGQDTVIHLWDPAKGEQRRVLKGHSAPIRAVTFSPDGQFIASAGEDARIILWRTATGVPAKILTGSKGAINVLVFDPRGRFLVSATEANDLTLWNVNSGAPLRTISVP